MGKKVHRVKVLLGEFYRTVSSHDGHGIMDYVRNNIKCHWADLMKYSE